MEINQFIYTKVSPEDTPWGRTDFHTIFYPLNILKKPDVVEIEKKIHFPQIPNFNIKRTFFYQKIDSKYYLIILYIKNLPEDTDTFGRKGLFLCHGFLFPEEIWGKYYMPYTLFTLVKDKVLNSRNEIFNSIYIDREKGDMKPINVAENEISDIEETFPSLIENFDKDIFLLLNRIVSNKGNNPTLIFKAEIEEIEEYLNNLLAYIPNENKIYLALDPAFDGGNLTFSPIKIVGFSKEPPTGGNPIKIDLKNKIIENYNAIKDLLTPKNSYEKWIYSCSDKIYNYEQIYKGYMTSIFIESSNIDIDSSKLLLKDDCFINVNLEIIRKTFKEKSTLIIGEWLSKFISRKIEPLDMLLLLYEKIPKDKIAKLVEDIIFEENPPVNEIEKAIVELKSTGSPSLSVIYKMIKNINLTEKDFKMLSSEEKLKIFKFFILNGYINKDSFLNILKADKELFTKLVNDNSIKKYIENKLIEIITKKIENRDYARMILDEIFAMGLSYNLLNETVDYEEIISNIIKKRQLNKKDKEILEKMISKKEKQNKILKIINKIRGKNED